MFLSCIPVPKIAEQLNVPVHTVKKWADRGKWGRSRGQAIQTVRSGMQANVALYAANSLGDQTRAGLADVLAKQVAVMQKQPAKRVSQLAGRDGLATAAKTITDAAATIFGWSESRVIGLVDVRQLSSDHSSESPIIDVSTVDSAESLENVTEVIQSDSPQSVSPTTETT